MALKTRNVTAVLVDDGQQAVDAVSAHPNRFDLIFMDNTMPIKVKLVYARMSVCMRVRANAVCCGYAVDITHSPLLFL